MSDFNNDISNNGGPGSSAEPSMEEILASIRRILKDDNGALPAKVDIDDDVLLLDDSMLARKLDFSSGTELPEAMPPPPDMVAPHPDAAGAAYPEMLHFSSEPTFSVQDYANDDTRSYPPDDYIAGDEQSAPYQADNARQSMNYQQEDHMGETYQPPHGMLSEEASHAAATSIGALVRSISADRSVAVSRGGVTIEDIVREEIRPVLKAWLDTHLPSLVERLVRAEIERVIDRGTS